MAANAKTPLERVEQLYADLVVHYGEGDKRELRAAAKILPRCGQV